MQNCGTVVSMCTKETLATGVRPSNPMIGLAVSQLVEQKGDEFENDAQQMLHANRLEFFAFGCDWQVAASQKKP